MINFLHSKVFHSRRDEAKHSFSYSVPFLHFNVEACEEMQKQLSSKSLGLYSLKSKNYLKGEKGSLSVSVKNFLKQNFDFEADEINLITSPGTLGYAFNPVSFWICKIQKEFTAVLVEVNNTFGERHFYWINQEIPIDPDKWYKVTKAFYVSPFMAVEGYYEFKFVINKDFVDIKINHFSDEGKLKLLTSITGPLENISETSSLHLLSKYGPSSILITFRIHYQAIKLYLKSVTLKKKPQQDKKDISS